MPEPLRFYTSKDFLPKDCPHFAILYPFWGELDRHEAEPDSGRYDQYIEDGREIFEPTDDVASAEVLILPFAWQHARAFPEAQALARDMASLAAQQNKPLLVFFWSDSEEHVPIDAVVFRTSLSRSTRLPNEFAMPAWTEDFIGQRMGNHLPLRPKLERPVVGFCGYAGPRLGGEAGIKGMFRKLGRRIKHRNRPLNVREQAILSLLPSDKVRCNFTIRDQFWAGLGDPTKPANLRRQAKDDFMRNMIDSDYILCARGGGNFSYRLYETLSCGRIPIIVDTDIVLPFMTDLDWKKFCVWLRPSELGGISEKIHDFHQNLTPDEFIELQQQCRRHWEESLSPAGFFSRMARLVRSNAHRDTHAGMSFSPDENDRECAK